MPRRRRILVPEARPALDRLKRDLMEEKGFTSDQGRDQPLEEQVAGRLGIPLGKGDDGDLTTRQAGKVGGAMGGPLVRKLIEMAQQQLVETVQDMPEANGKSPPPGTPGRSDL
ncbi:MAG: alpha/beta-type small acid-soluble spore protein [Kyrpidia tusciae]|nr:alpha/beta-type small acid-soluble spore protein [Kyrpidia tusciae]MBE3552858.1 alpha/beta-type small acid-soluble spore protein [Kyrpidia tusciae]